MARRRHTPEQIISKLREAEQLQAEGATIGEAAKQLDISEQTFQRRRNQYGGMKADAAKQLKELERENARLTRTWPTMPFTATRSRRSPGESSKPGTPTCRRDHAATQVRQILAAGLPGHRPAPLHPALPA